jgi:hypothetical protein
MANTANQPKLQNMFHRQLNYVLGILSTRKKGIDIIILKKRPKTNSALEDNGYETHVFVYNNKHDMLVLDMKGNKEVGKKKF